MENQLSRLTVTEIKALVYDELAKVELAQNNIRVLNQELRNRVQPQPPQSQETEVVTPSDYNLPQSL